jgi:hypothetical protein
MQDLSVLTERLSRINEDLARKMQGMSGRRAANSRKCCAV